MQINGRTLALVGVVALLLLALVPLQGLLAGQTQTVSPPDATSTEVATGSLGAAASTPAPMATATSAPTATPAPTPTPSPPTSYLEGTTMLTIYGRAWGTAPILGRLGMMEGPDDMEREIAPWIEEIKKVNDGKEVVPVIHLIYAMAIPCEPDNHCLLYLDTAGFDIVEDYIKPAAERGWHVILDSQTGSSNPVEQVQRMIDRGYLQYPHVHVAIDPEFHVYPGEDIPGIPIGVLEASEINRAQKILNDYVNEMGLPHKKILMVHQFGDANVDDGNPFMIQNKHNLEIYPNVDLVIDADGFGAPGIKIKKYNMITDHEVYPFLEWRAIKLFFFNPYEEAHHFDYPVMPWPLVFGEDETPEGIRMRYKPDIVVVA